MDYLIVGSCTPGTPDAEVLAVAAMCITRVFPSLDGVDMEAAEVHADTCGNIAAFIPVCEGFDAWAKQWRAAGGMSTYAMPGRG